MNFNLETIPGVFFDQVQRLNGRCALKYKEVSSFKDISWSDFGQKVKFFSLGLMKLGLNKGDKVAILSENRPEWAFCDLGIISAGAISVPIYATDTAKEVEYILNDCQAKIVAVSHNPQLDKILSIENNLTALQYIIIFNSENRLDGKFILTFDEILKLGREVEKGDLLFGQNLEVLKSEDAVTIIYTSGTTGEPKGAMLTHNNFLSNCRSAAQVLPITENDTYLSFLPLSHVFERMAGYYMMIHQGATIAYAQNLDTVAEDIKIVKPTVTAGVPRFYEKIYAKILDKAIHSSFIKKHLFFWSIKIGRKYGQKKLNKKKIDLWLKLKHKIASVLVFTKLKNNLGGRLRFFISGGAPLAKEIAEFFYSAGVIILEGYGLTETSPVISVNTLERFKFGTVGRLLPGVEVKISQDGEILTKGPHIMKGYHNKPEQTNEVLKEGWFYTGDIGSIDQDGFLVITDRKKEIIVTSGGKNVAPQYIENLLKSDRYISQVMLCGDKRKYLTALIAPNFENLKRYARYKKIAYNQISDLIKQPGIINFISRRIAEKTKELASFEQIKYFTLIDREFSQPGGELTPTLKLKRKVIAEKYKNILESMYEKEF